MINILKLNWNSHFDELSSSSCLPFGLRAASSCGRQDTRESVTNCRQLRTIYANPAVWAGDQQTWAHFRIVFDCRLWENHKQTHINKHIPCAYIIMRKLWSQMQTELTIRVGSIERLEDIYLSRRDDSLGAGLHNRSIWRVSEWRSTWREGEIRER